MAKEEKVVYYEDDLQDDFAGMNIERRVVDEKFKYLHRGLLWRGCAFVLYYLIAAPLVWVMTYGFMGVRFVNRKALKKCEGPCFIYGNHTGWYDAYICNLVSMPRRNDIIVAAETVSIKGLRGIVQMLGAIPLPSGMMGMRQFMGAVEYQHRRCNITIFPEAHIWPYYTGVRPFSDASFAYPVNMHSPVIAFFTAYTKPRGLLAPFRKANMTVYVSDPIYPDENLTGKAARKYLRDKVYEFMKESSAHSTYEVMKYKKRS